MQTDSSPNIEFSLVDVVLPLAEMWKILLLLPVLVAGMVYLALQFYPAEATYNATVHLPEPQVRALANEEALTRALATVNPSDTAMPMARELVRLQIAFNKDDETGLVLTLPRHASSPRLLGAIIGMFEPAADRFLDEQKRQVENDIALSLRTVANLKASSAATNAALETAEQASAGGIGHTSEITKSLIDVTNTLAGSQAWLGAHQMRASELASVNAVKPFRLASNTNLIAALSGGGMLSLILAFIYVRQEFLFALSHENGRRKVARIKQCLRIFRGGDPKQP